MVTMPDALHHDPAIMALSPLSTVSFVFFLTSPPPRLPDLSPSSPSSVFFASPPATCPTFFCFPCLSFHHPTFLNCRSFRPPLSPSPFLTSPLSTFLTCHPHRLPLSSPSFFSSPRYPSSHKTMKRKRSKNSYPPQNQSHKTAKIGGKSKNVNFLLHFLCMKKIK